ncbi:MAG: FixH family protein [Pseudomonadota bacterium]
MSFLRSAFGNHRWIPWLFAGLFMIVLAVNGSMIFVAFTTFPGLETTNAYQRGLAYNQQIAAVDEQEALGWTVGFDVTQEEGRRVALRLDLEDRFGNFVRNAVVQGRFMRPTHEGVDRTVTLDYQTGGRYEARVDLPLDGQWDLHLAVDAAGQTYLISERVFLRP